MKRLVTCLVALCVCFGGQLSAHSAEESSSDGEAHEKHVRVYFGDADIQEGKGVVIVRKVDDDGNEVEIEETFRVSPESRPRIVTETRRAKVQRDVDQPQERARRATVRRFRVESDRIQRDVDAHLDRRTLRQRKDGGPDGGPWMNLAPAGQPARDLDRRLHHLREAAKHLQAAGYEELLVQIRKREQTLHQQRAQRARSQQRGESPGAAQTRRLMESVDQLHKQVAAMREELALVRKQLQQTARAQDAERATKEAQMAQRKVRAEAQLRARAQAEADRLRAQEAELRKRVEQERLRAETARQQAEEARARAEDEAAQARAKAVEARERFFRLQRESKDKKLEAKDKPARAKRK